MEVIEDKIMNREVIIDPYITNSAWFLHTILLTYGITGVHQEYFGFPLVSIDQPVDVDDPEYVYSGSRVYYDSEHFRVVKHKRGKESILYASPDSKYYKESRLLSKIDMTQIGRGIKVPYYTAISPKAVKFNTILDDICSIEFTVASSPGYIQYDERYYEYVDGMIDVKPEYAEYISISH